MATMGYPVRVSVCYPGGRVGSSSEPIQMIEAIVILLSIVGVLLCITAIIVFL